MQTQIYGLHSVQAHLELHPQLANTLFVAEQKTNDRVNAILALAKRHNIPVQKLGADELDKRVEGNHQGVLLDAKAIEPMQEKQLLKLIEQAEEAPLLLILDTVTDPHNLGACLRTADAAGVTAVIIPKDKAVGLTPVVRRVACGAAEVVPLVAVTNLARTMKSLQQAGVWLVGTAGEATTELHQQSLTGPLGIVMGAEGTGMRRLTREACDFLVKIPMAGTVSSLNVSVAAGVCLFEAVRQRS